jgi:putative oxidoreductase
MVGYDFGALALRLMLAGEFGASGIADLKDPVGRAKENGVSRPFIIFIAVAEIAGSLGLVAGVLARAAAVGLIAIMAGALYKKIFVWKIGYWGTTNVGWHYELLLTTALLMIALAGAGQLALLPSW